MRRASGRRHRARRTRRAVTKAGRAVRALGSDSRRVLRGPGIGAQFVRRVAAQPCPVAPGARPHGQVRTAANAGGVHDTASERDFPVQIRAISDLHPSPAGRRCRREVVREPRSEADGRVWTRQHRAFRARRGRACRTALARTSRKATAGGAAPGCRPRRSRPAGGQSQRR